MQRLSDLYKKWSGSEPYSVTPIVGAGSERKYYRLNGKSGSVVGTIGVCKAENTAFIYMAHEFSKMELPVPKVLAVSEDNMVYLQSYAGDISLFDYLSESRNSGTYTTTETVILENVMSDLAKFHSADSSNFDFGVCYPTPEMNSRAVSWDLNYFKYSFLKTVGIEFDENLLENDFEKLIRLIGDCGMNTIILRDCQSRNVLLNAGNNPVFIDFQGARKGCGLYDVVSFLWQARAAFPSSLREHLFKHYISSLPKSDSEKTALKSQLPLFITLRTLQVLGAYGFLGLIKKKEHFVRCIPAAIDNVRELLTSNFPELPELKAVLHRIADCKLFGNRESLTGPLVVTVGSFSYKMGFPEDDSGNGGGFVFDCRALPNPGRYDEYKQLTGRDEAVIKFLEQRADVQSFLESAWNMMDYSVEHYIARGFTSLSIFFGCTGGRHRSVFCAERTAAHIKEKFGKEKFGVEVRLVHRERKISETL